MITLRGRLRCACARFFAPRPERNEGRMQLLTERRMACLHLCLCLEATFTPERACTNVLSWRSSSSVRHAGRSHFLWCPGMLIFKHSGTSHHEPGGDRLTGAFEFAQAEAGAQEQVSPAPSTRHTQRSGADSPRQSRCVSLCTRVCNM